VKHKNLCELSPSPLFTSHPPSRQVSLSDYEAVWQSRPINNFSFRSRSPLCATMGVTWVEDKATGCARPEPLTGLGFRFSVV
jgi:hypothetical protein